jgi:uncharacterized protein YjbI with pentapeptide repeats
MPRDLSHQNLQRVSFRGEDLSSASLSDSDLRGANFSNTDLTGADLSKARTGITRTHALLIFLVALVISAASGYVAMLAGRTIQGFFASKEANLRAAGYTSVSVLFLFIGLSWWKGVGHAIRNLIIPATAISLFIAIVARISGLGTGKGMLFLVLFYMLLALMFIVGTVARTAAGSLSNVLFIIVALVGGIFGKSVGGDIAAFIMAMSCAMISKRALSGAKGFDSLRKVASYITRKYGTSFRNSKLSQTNFSHSKIRNCDFSNCDISTVDWNEATLTNCLVNENELLKIKKQKSKGSVFIDMAPAPKKQ